MGTGGPENPSYLMCTLLSDPAVQASHFQVRWQSHDKPVNADLKRLLSAGAHISTAFKIECMVCFFFFFQRAWCGNHAWGCCPPGRNSWFQQLQGCELWDGIQKPCEDAGCGFHTARKFFRTAVLSQVDLNHLRASTTSTETKHSTEIDLPVAFFIFSLRGHSGWREHFGLEWFYLLQLRKVYKSLSYI